MKNVFMEFKGEYPIVNDYLHPDQVVACPYCQVEAEFENLDEGLTLTLEDSDGDEFTVIDYLVECPRCKGKFIIRSYP